MKNKELNCIDCRYNTPKPLGLGRVCNGSIMARYARCPEWAINEYLEKVKPKYLIMGQVIQHNKIRKAVISRAKLV